MLEAPVGTGVLSMPVYETMPDADITCLDYSSDMMERAKRRAEKRSLKNVRFMQGDVGKMPFQDETDFLVDKIYTPKGYFTPPYETADSLRKRLKGMYRKAEVKTVEGMAVFRCRKRKRLSFENAVEQMPL